MQSWERTDTNPTWRGMNIMKRQVDELLNPKNTNGEPVGRMFCSGPGLGKTEIVAHAIKKFDVSVKFLTPKSAYGLAQVLWLNRNKVIVIDDSDELPKDNEAMNIAKNAWGASRRVVSPSTSHIQRNYDFKLTGAVHPSGYKKGEEMYNPSIPDPEFTMGPKHRVIWLSNLNYEDFQSTLRAAQQAVFSGVASRVPPRWINSEPQNAFDYSIWMVVVGDMLRNHPMAGTGGFKLDVAQDVLNFFCTKAPYLQELSPRFVNRLAIIRQRERDWQMEFAEMVSEKVRYPGLILPQQVPQILAYKKAAKGVQTIQQPEPPKPYPDPDPPVAAMAPLADRIKVNPALLDKLKAMQAKAASARETNQQPDMKNSDEKAAVEPLCSRGVIALHKRRNGNERDIVMTPLWFAKEIIDYFAPNGFVLDPSRGESRAFYDQYPENVRKDWCKVRENKNFFDWHEPVDWVIGNTPWSGHAFTAFLSHSLKLANDVALLIPSAMGLTTKKRIRIMHQFGHGLKEIVFYDWPKEWQQFAFTLTVHHWQRGWTGATQLTNMMADKKLAA